MSDYNNKYPCVRCGFCCGVGRDLPCHCGMGAVGEGAKCKYLIEEDPLIGTYKCGRYEEISALEKNAPYPMFGCGCSSPLFNTVRNAVIAKS